MATAAALIRHGGGSRQARPGLSGAATICLLAHAVGASAQSAAPAKESPPDPSSEIVVVAQQGDRSSIDRTTYVVRDTPEARSANGIDLLSHVPFVDVSPSGAIRLLGTGGVKILVDGKEVVDANAMLRDLQGAQVAKIEVISNPSAQFSARGTGGIINIVTRRTASPGVGGSVTADADNFGRGELKISPTWSRGRVSVSGSIGAVHDGHQASETEEERYRQSPDGSLAFESRERTSSRNRGDHLSGNAMISYKLTEKQTISLTAYASGGNNGSDGISELFFAADPATPVTRTSAGKGRFNLIDVSADYRREGKRTGETLTVSAKTSRVHFLNEDFYITTGGAGGRGTFALQSDWLRSTSTFKVDYVRPFAKERRLSLGGALQATREDQSTTAAGEATPGDTPFTLFSEAEGSFVEESGYVTYQSPLLGGTALAGLRVEGRQYSFRGSPAGSSSGQRHLFPSLHLERKLAKTLTGRLSYSRRVNWPEISALDPAVRFNDPRTAFVGNVALRPELTHAFEAKLTLKGKRRTVEMTAFSRHTSDLWSSLGTLDAAGVLTSRQVNFGTRLLRGASIAVQGTIGRSFSYSLNGNVADERLRSNGQVRAFAGEGTQYDAGVKLEYHDGQDGRRGADRVTLNARYSGPRFNGLLRVESYVHADASWSHGLSDRLSSVLKVSDLTGPFRFKSTSVSPDSFVRGTYGSRDRQITLSLSYSLGRRAAAAKP